MQYTADSIRFQANLGCLMRDESFLLCIFYGQSNFLISQTAEHSHQMYTKTSVHGGSWNCRSYTLLIVPYFYIGSNTGTRMIGPCAMKKMGLQFRRVENRPNKLVKSSITHPRLERLRWNFVTWCAMGTLQSIFKPLYR